LVAINTEENIRAKVNSDETTAPPLSFRRALEPGPSILARELGRSSVRFRNLPDGSSLEVSPTSSRIARKVGELLTSGKTYAPIGGCGLIIDYGRDHAFSDSLRVGSHKKIIWQKF
jgi:NADH dehydrogenase [ubiquinone] 1 alpha subcomplex assembly factor 7